MTLSTTSRLQKIIAARGYCSRRKAEELILSAKVYVEGKLVNTLGEKFPNDCEISIAGKKLSQNKAEITIVLNKPAGFECTKKTHDSKTKSIYDLLPEEFSHLNYAGRLDKESEGLIILSCNGELLNQLSHPRYEHRKTYVATVSGLPSEKDMKPLIDGKLKLDGKILNPMQFEILQQSKVAKTSDVQLKLSEGRKRQIRRVMEMLGFPVLKLCRTEISFGEKNLKLSDLNLKPGEYLELQAPLC